MTELQNEFEATGYASWINSDLYPDGKIYTQEYTRWLEKKVLELRKNIIDDGIKTHSCKHCGVETTQPDEECYKAPNENKT